MDAVTYEANSKLRSVVNVLLQNLYPEQAVRYPLSYEGLSRLTRDYYSHAITDKGQLRAPIMGVSLN